MSAPLRRLMLVLHVGMSVGWLGAVVASLALAVLGMTVRDPEVARSVYLVLEPVGWWTLVPFSVASLISGLIQGWGTRWGLVRHYWVLAKLLMNLFATGVLLLYMQTLGYLAGLARTAPAHTLRTASPVVHATAALVLLATALVLSIYKPRGLTPWTTPRPAARAANTAAR